MPGLSSFDCEGTLTIGGISMNRAAWAVVGDSEGQGGLLPLWVTVDQRGEDRLLPGTIGVIPYRRRATVTRHDLRLLVVGDVDLNGDPVVNTRNGLAANLAYLYTNVVAPVGTGDGTRSVTLTVFGQANRTGWMHVLGLQVQRYSFGNPTTEPSICEATLQISIPSGQLV